MKPYKKVILTGALLSALTFSGGSALAQDNSTNTEVSASSSTLMKDARLEAKAAAKAKIEAARAEEKAKREAAKAELKAKQEKIKADREAFVLKAAQDRFAKAVADAEASIAAASAKLAQAKAAAAAATDRTTFEAARKLFMEARQLLEKGMRPLASTPKVAPVTSTTPSLSATATAETTTQ
jgi:hypothetical protein